MSYLVAHAHLEDRAKFLRPFARHRGMFIPQLEQVAKKRHARDLWQTLDFGHVRVVQPADQQVDARDDDNGDGLYGHGGSRVQ